MLVQGQRVNLQEGGGGDIGMVATGRTLHASGKKLIRITGNLLGRNKKYLLDNLIIGFLVGKGVGAVQYGRA